MDTAEKQGELILLRGLPGSGKSTLAKIILQTSLGYDPEVLSDDDFFINENGEYKYESEKNLEAKNYCQFRCSERMRQNKARIVIANVFAEESDLEIYYDMSKRYNYRVHTVIVENRHGNENVHDYSEERINNMRNNFDIKL